MGNRPHGIEQFRALVGMLIRGAGQRKQVGEQGDVVKRASRAQELRRGETGTRRRDSDTVSDAANRCRRASQSSSTVRASEALASIRSPPPASLAIARGRVNYDVDPRTGIVA